MHGALYRARQLFRGFRTTLRPDEVTAVRATLSEAELLLFLAMDARGRREAVDMMRWLEKRARPSDELLAAALLHDAGKGALTVRDRVAFVVLEAWSPGLLDRLATERGSRWRRALWTLRHHARLGAQLLVDAGARPRVVELVARHTEATNGASSEADEELVWLIAADDAC